MTVLNNCLLCELPTAKKERFCCTGCHTVYQILTAKNVTSHFTEHPLYQKALAAGIITDAATRPETKSLETKSCYLEIGKMWCASCAYLIELLLLKKPGVASCTVDYATDIACIAYDPTLLSKAKLKELIRDFGYEADDWCDQKEQKAKRKSLLDFSLGLVLFFYLMMFAYPLYISSFGIAIEGYEKAFGFFSLILTLPIISYLFRPLWQRFRLEVSLRQLGMYSLVLLSVSAAFLYSVVQLGRGAYDRLYFDSMAAVMAGLFLGRYLQAKAKVSVKEKMLSLERFLPRRARTQEGFVPLKEVNVGDRLVALAGEKIVLDGVVSAGKGAVDEAMLTGELSYVCKEAGDPLLAGTLLKEGSVEFTVTKSSKSSTLQQMVAAIDHSLQRGNSRALFSRFMHYFVFAVALLGLGTLAVSHDFMRMLSVFLIACPCVIGIAKPLVDTFLVQKLASLGILVRNAEALDRLSEPPHFVFDKTNTLTKGAFTLLSGLEQLNEKDKGVIKALTDRSIHPLACALNQKFTSACHLEVQEILGEGLYGKDAAHEYRLGSRRFMEKNGITIATFPQPAKAATRLYFSVDSQCNHYFDLADEVRECSLKGTILSGDRKEVVEAVAQQLGCTDYQGELSPQEKQKEVQKLQEHHSALIMVGDGINDTLAMATADVSIAMKKSSPMALEVADLILMNDSLDTLRALAPLVVKAKRSVKQNYYWSFGYNGLGIALAMGGFLTPFLAALAMLLSTVIVLGNSLLLKRNF